MADGSHGGWIPRLEDLYRVEFQTALCIDRDGVASSMGRYGRPTPWTGTKMGDPQAEVTTPSTETVIKQLDTARSNTTSGIGPMLQNGFFPMDFLSNSAGFSLGTQVSPPDKHETSGQPLDMPSLLRTELTMYNNLMTDIGEATRFFDQEYIRNRSLPGSTPPLSMEHSGSIQGWEFQTPETVSR